MDKIYNNKYALLNIKPKYNWFIIISIIIVLILTLASIYIKTYDTFNYSGIFIQDKIILNVDTSDTKNIINSDFLKIDDKIIKFSVDSVSEIRFDKYTHENYQTIILSTSNKYIDNLKLDITFYKNKQRIIVKLLALLKWKGSFMEKLKEQELYEITGGAVKKSVIFGILAVGALIAGIIDGLLRPLKCNK